MKTNLFKNLAILLILAGSFYSCEKSDEPNDDEPFLFRYLYGERYYMRISPNQVVVRFGEGVAENDIISFMRENASLRVSDIRTISGGEFKLIYFHGNNRNAIIQLANGLKPNDTVLFVGYVIVNEWGRRTSALTNQVNVKLKNDSDFPILMEAIAPFDIKKVRQSEFDSRFYLLTTNCLSGESTLQIANELHRTGLFEWATPDLILFIQFGI